MYRIPEGLSCDEGVFKTHHHPVVDWHGPTGNGMLWHEWETNDADYETISSYPQAEAFGMTFIQGVQYRVIVNHTAYGLDLKFTIRNITKDKTFHNVVGVPCLGSPSETFVDSDLKRTMISVDDTLTTLCLTNRATGDPCRTHYRVGENAPIKYCAKPFWGELSQTIASDGSILRISSDDRYTIGTAWEDVAEVWDNQDAHGCLHSNFSIGDLNPGETRSVSGRIILVESSPEEALSLLAFQ